MKQDRISTPLTAGSDNEKGRMRRETHVCIAHTSANASIGPAISTWMTTTMNNMKAIVDLLCERATEIDTGRF